MSIRWDSLLVHHIAEELNDLLAGARLRAIRLDGAARDLALLFREQTVVWRLHPTRGYPLLRPAIEPSEGDLLFPFRVRRVAAPPDERIVRFELIPTRGGRKPHDLFVELLGNQWNAVVTEADTGIVRHLLWTRKNERAPVTGHRYQAPPLRTRRGISGDLSRESWRTLIGGSSSNERAKTLITNVAWASPLNADAILETQTEETDPDEAYERWHRLIPPREREPVTLDTARGPQPYPFPLPGIPHTPVGSLLSAFEKYASASDEPVDLPGSSGPLVPTDLARRLNAALVQASRRAERLRDELAALEDPQRLRELGDLILARYPDIAPGAREVVLMGFSGDEVRVDLDPGEAPHENAARYYQRAAKSERARTRIPALLDEARTKLSGLTELARRAEAGEAPPDEIIASLPAVRVRAQGHEAGQSLPYRVFRSSGGLEIRVGRGARHNDDLTFHHSAPNDVWLHARHSAGAHVVLRWPGPGSPPAKDLEEAGSLAALHSKARTSSSVPIDWTLRKYVRKPRGSAPGSVVPDRVKTIFVDPDPTLKDTLDAG